MAKSMRKSCRKGGMKRYRKGSKSNTMKCKKDFTTKKTSKVFNRRGHYQKHAKGSRKVRAPYHKKGGFSKPENELGGMGFDPNSSIPSPNIKWPRYI